MQKLTLLKTAIRRDSAGRFCLNDLHRAAGLESAHQPSNWLGLDTTRALIEEISNSSDVMSKPIAVTAGRYGGIYAIRELIYAYAMWVSPKFHLAVIRAFDVPVTEQTSNPSPILANEHPFVAQFWDTYEELIERGERVNYSDKQGLIAINLTTLLLAAWRRGLPVAERSKLSRVLKTSVQRPFIGHEDMFFRGRRIPKCWMFRDDGRPQNTTHAPPLRLTDAISAAPDILFSQKPA
jgi:hypothetical protein